MVFGKKDAIALIDAKKKNVSAIVMQACHCVLKLLRVRIEMQAKLHADVKVSRAAFFASANLRKSITLCRLKIRSC